jgi:hypothetical protein
MLGAVLWGGDVGVGSPVEGSTPVRAAHWQHRPRRGATANHSLPLARLPADGAAPAALAAIAPLALAPSWRRGGHVGRGDGGGKVTRVTPAAATSKRAATRIK